jgi:L-lactate dehydrogenase complex protein LldG
LVQELSAEDLDPVHGFVAALRRHLSSTEPSAARADPEDLSTPGAAEPTDLFGQTHPPLRDDVVSNEPDVSEREHGDRQRFLDIARQRLGTEIPFTQVPPHQERADAMDDPADAPGADAAVPTPSYPNLNADDLVGTFLRALEEAGGTAHVVDQRVPDPLLDHLIAELGAWEVVVSTDPEAVELGERLAARGVEVSPAAPEAASRAAIGVTVAVAGIAATGSVVLDSRGPQGHLSSLLPPVHLCLLPVGRLVATPGDYFGALGADPTDPAPTVTVLTGPSRRGDIEQLLLHGDRGPTALHVVLVR